MPSKKKMQGMVWEAAVLHNDREVDRVVIHSVPGIRDHFGMDVETQKKKRGAKIGNLRLDEFTLCKGPRSDPTVWKCPSARLSLGVAST